MLANVQTLTLPLSAAASQYRFLKIANAGSVIQAAAAGDDAVAVSLEGRSAQDITDGKTTVTVALPGCKVFITAGAAIDVSAAIVPVTTDSTGRAVAVAAATDRVLGYALQSAGAANEIIEILFLKAADRRDA